jgi:predicted extracellular nuclease
VINSFVAEILACQPDANVIVLGDMNDFDFSLPVQALAGDELTNLATLLPANQRYSYIYQGNSQLFDQILVSRSLMNDHDPAFDLVHINAEFPEDQQVTDHDPAIARFDFGP